MTEQASTEEFVQRGNVEKMLRSAVKSERANAIPAGRVAYWIALIAGAALTIIAIARFAGQELEVWTLLQADDGSVKSELARNGAAGANPAYLETLAELGVRPETKNHEAALAAARRTVEADPSRAGAWAQLAFLEYSKDSKLTPAAIDALKRSMDACLVCSQDLVRWRFNFVLANWEGMPDEIRRKAFEQADILRWMGQNSEFLAEMRVKARLAGIPFDDYRAAVNTPFRSWDIGPAGDPAQAEGAIPQPRT
jgi:hypothetical protein